MLRKCKNKISSKLIFINLVSIALVTVLLSYAAYRIISSIYEKTYNEKTLLCNRIVATNISGDNLNPYIDKLKNDEQLKIKQVKYNELRQKVYELQENTTPEKEKELKATQKEMVEIRQGFQIYKDENYKRLQQDINDLKKSSGAKYLYILADTGVPDVYTYILDAHEEADGGSLDYDDLGTVDTQSGFSSVTKVMETARQMEVAEYYESDIFGKLFFAYAPILDSKGNVVAVVGTDMALDDMYLLVGEMIRTNFMLLFVVALLVWALTYLILDRFVVEPIKSLVTVGYDILEGNIYTEVPEKLVKRSDEIGLLAHTFKSVLLSFQSLVSSTKELFDAAMVGRLDVRSDPSRFKGDFAKILTQFNSTLDVVERYFDNIPESLFIVNSDLKPLYQNKHFVEVFGPHKNVEEILRLIFSENGESCADLKAELESLMEKGNHISVKWFETKNGDMRCLSVICCKMTVGAETTGIIFIASDITDFMIEKDNAQKANKAKSEFLSRISHELRTPLNAIVGISNLGLKTVDVPQKSEERFKSIVDASAHLLGIINDVLDMSRIESGKTELKNEPFNLKALAAEAVSLTGVQAAAKGIKLTQRIDEKIPDFLVGDFVRLRQVLVNIIANAVKFTDAGGIVSLDAILEECDGEHAKILMKITDNGIGMSEEFLKKIFLPFEQEELYLKRRYEGTGLGLSISFGIVSLMGGCIDVKSELGKGSEFSIALPFEVAEKGSAPFESEGADALAGILLEGKKILLVDDIEINRAILVELLGGLRLEIEEATNGAEAFEKFVASAPGHYSMILMDIQMPEMDGYDCTKAIRTLDREDARTVPIVAMTANALREDVEAAQKAGMNDHLAKPIDFDLCIGMIRKYCGSNPSIAGAVGIRRVSRSPF